MSVPPCIQDADTRYMSETRQHGFYLEQSLFCSVMFQQTQDSSLVFVGISQLQNKRPSHEGRVTALTLLDLSVAIDTLGHSSITNLLSTWYGIDGIALDWFVSYLSDRKQKVKLMDCLSSLAEVACGVPQGSVLGPLLFTLYTTPLSYVIRRHNFKHHLYADDTQIYLSLSLKNPDISLEILTKYLQDVSS